MSIIERFGFYISIVVSLIASTILYLLSSKLLAKLIEQKTGTLVSFDILVLSLTIILLIGLIIFFLLRNDIKIVIKENGLSIEDLERLKKFNSLQKGIKYYILDKAHINKKLLSDNTIDEIMGLLIKNSKDPLTLLKAYSYSEHIFWNDRKKRFECRIDKNKLNKLQGKALKNMSISTIFYIIFGIIGLIPICSQIICPIIQYHPLFYIIVAISIPILSYCLFKNLITYLKHTNELKLLNL